MSIKSDDYSPHSAIGRYELPGTAADSEPELSALSNGIAVGRRAMLFRPAYLNEDEAVLACCHHAHEVARAHGAREVMLDHLVHALARVPAAATVLEDRGIHVEALRRDSATVISSEIPVDHTIAPGQLKASRDFNTVMFLAAAGASHRDERMTGVRDVLEALLKYDPKSRAVRLVRRHAAGADIEERADPVGELKLAMDRYVAEAREMRLVVSDLRASQIGHGSSLEAALDQRLYQLEKTVQSLAAEVGSDRQILADRLQRALTERLQQLERSMSGHPGASQMQAVVGDRIQMLQKGLETLRLDVQRLEAGVVERMKTTDRADDQRQEELTRLHQALAERMTAIEDAVTSDDASVGIDLKPVVEQQVAATKQVMETLRADISRLDQMISERIRGIEPPRIDISRIETLVGDRLRAVERSLETQVVNMQRGTAQLADKLHVIERATAGLGDRMMTLEGTISEQPRLLEQRIVEKGVNGADVGGLSEHLAAIERSVQTMTGHSAKTIAGLEERIGLLDRTVTAQRSEVSTINKALDSELEQIRKALSALGHAQATLSTAIDEWRQNNSGDLSIISNRLAALEKVASTVQTAVPQQVGLVDKVDRALRGRYNAS